MAEAEQTITEQRRANQKTAEAASLNSQQGLPASPQKGETVTLEQVQNTLHALNNPAQPTTPR